MKETSNEKKWQLSSIEQALETFRRGEIVIVVDDEDRENEGDFIVAAEKITPEIVNFMLRYGRGVLCAPITMSRCEELNLAPQVNNNTSILGTPFTVTVDLIEGCSTGVSAADRAATIRALADPTRKAEDLVVLGISIRSMRKIRVCFVVQDTPRPPLTWLVCQVCSLLQHSSRS